jgi:ribosomal protein S18 acetylase RimI-like enzyme
LKLTFRPADEQNISKVVELHKKALNIGLMSQIGGDFLIRYYKKLIKFEACDEAWSRCVYNQKKMVGFIFITKRPIPFFMFCKYPDFFNLLKLIILKPTYLIILFNYIFFKNKLPLAVNVFEITSFAIDESSRGLGIGNKLLDLSIRWSKSKGAKGIFTFTHNTSLVNFYKKKYKAIEISNKNLIMYRLQLLFWSI